MHKIYLRRLLHRQYMLNNNNDIALNLLKSPGHYIAYKSNPVFVKNKNLYRFYNFLIRG